MSYAEAMEAAGAKVLAFEEFGSYQGEWWAKVEFNGVTGFVGGSYGSCSGCDAFQSEFGYGSASETPEKLAAFGLSYLDNIITIDEAVAIANKNSSWDVEADEMVKWLKENT